MTYVTSEHTRLHYKMSEIGRLVEEQQLTKLLAALTNSACIVVCGCSDRIHWVHGASVCKSEPEQDQNAGRNIFYFLVS